VEPTTSILGPVIKPETRQTLIKHLNSYDFWALIGITYSVEIAKSFITAMACIDRHLLVEEGIHIASLETDFQVTRRLLKIFSFPTTISSYSNRFATGVVLNGLMMLKLLSSKAGLQLLFCSLI